MISPARLVVPSALRTRMGRSKGMRGSLKRWIKVGWIYNLEAPESRSACVSTVRCLVCSVTQ